MTSFIIQNFLLHNIEEDKAVLQNKENTTLLQNSKMIEFLEYIEEEKKEYVSEEDINSFFQEEKNEAINFLLEIKLMKKKIKDLVSFETLILVSDSEFLQKNLKKSLSEKTIKNIICMSVEDFLNISEKIRDALIICFLDKFSDARMNKVIELSKESYLLLSYTYNHSIILNCLYSPDLGLPCPKCTKKVLEGQIYDSSGGMSYQQLLKMIYEIDPLYEVEYPLTSENYLQLTLLILQQTNLILLTENQIDYDIQEYTNIFKLSLAQNDYIKDTAIYWELCDCYE